MYPSLHHLKVTFFKEATSFIQQMEEVIPAASDLLGSSNTTDVRCVCSNDSYARFSSVTMIISAELTRQWVLVSEGERIGCLPRNVPTLWV
jgi:hypothetical protein